MMSVRGQKRKSMPRPIMSALPPKAGIHPPTAMSEASRLYRGF